MFAESAKNRDSVMSLGSIAHLQYYFARTGLLDGKGAQHARERKDDGGMPSILADGSNLHGLGQLSDIVDSPVGEEDESQEWDDQMMLPPTVSTYSHRTQYIPPPPDAETLRKDLQTALKDVSQALHEVRHQAENNLDRRKESEPLSVQLDSCAHEEEAESDRPSPMQGWHEIQGMHILDVATLAIRAAKIYYTTHEHPQRLSCIKPERKIRQELLCVLDVLKRMAARNFAGGMKVEELQTIEDWVQGVEALLTQERAIETQEAKDKESWKWLEGSWSDTNVQREWLFMCTFLPEGTLPAWTTPSETTNLPTPFLESLRNGLTLVQLHNTILKKSKRQFGEIKTFHADTVKPYRCAENLRYWVKAAEIRWETKLQLDVMGVVYGKNDEAWRGLDAAILQWCRAVREEIRREWREGTVQVSSSPSLTAGKRDDML
ncbi:hypothetical protein MMC24_002065 [Lignoscripta atroalba]|nr:hypothetical protein [Lignoscripta atroalba]